MRHALMRHLETHEDTKPEELFQCDSCPSNFSQRRYLKEHERKQDSGENEHLCSIFGENLPYLKKHNLVREHFCEQCGKECPT
jgi:uncharacterized Zn-finger protein